MHITSLSVQETGPLQVLWKMAVVPVNDVDRPGGLTAQVTERGLKPNCNGEFSKKMIAVYA